MATSKTGGTSFATIPEIQYACQVRGEEAEGLG